MERVTITNKLTCLIVYPIFSGMDIKEHSKYWIDSAEHDLESAEILYASAKYVWCLFLVHIVIEKAIKAIFVLSNNNDTPPKIHNLVRLAQLSRLELTDEQIDLLDRINDFNLEARYPDYKFSHYCPIHLKSEIQL